MREPALIFFDGHCHLCCRSVRFILRRDIHRHFQFAPLNGPTAQRLLLGTGESTGSVILLEDGRIHTHSSAILLITRHLSGGWPLLYALRFLPRSFRDGCYRIIARNRYRWFGRSESCWIPEREWKERLLD